MPSASEYVCVTNSTKSTRLGDRIQVADHGLDGIIGLLGRKSLSAGTGLLIVPTQAVHTIGMSFPIDLVFIDKANRVVGTRENIPPYRISRLYWRALGVLELPVGTIKSSRTEVGDQLRVLDSLTDISTDLSLPVQQD